MSASDPSARVQTMTMSAVAAALCVNPRTIYRWIAADKFPRPIKLHGSTRFIAADIEGFIRGKRAGGMS